MEKLKWAGRKVVERSPGHIARRYGLLLALNVYSPAVDWTLNWLFNYLKAVLSARETRVPGKSPGFGLSFLFILLRSSSPKVPLRGENKLPTSEDKRPLCFTRFQFRRL